MGYPAKPVAKHFLLLTLALLLSQGPFLSPAGAWHPSPSPPFAGADFSVGGLLSASWRGEGGGFLILAGLTGLATSAQPAPSEEPMAHPMGMEMGMRRHRLMLRYRFGQMGMEGLRQGRSRRSVEEVLESFPVTPEQMSMQAHMVELMYMAGEREMFMLMGSYKSLSMRHRTRMGTRFVTRSRGLGDLLLLWQHSPRGHMAPGPRYRLGISIPTGSVSKRGRTPMNESAKLPYAMQLGSGTWDLVLGYQREYLQGRSRWGFGLEGVLRTGRNSSGYRLGNELSAELWKRYPLGRKAHLRLSLAGEGWKDIRGRDPELNPSLVPTAGPHIQGGTRLDLGLDLSLSSRPGMGRNQGIALGIRLPLYQNLHGPQLERDYRLTISGFLRW